MMDKIKQWFKDIKFWIKSKTMWFNGMMVPVVTYLIENPELWNGYAGAAANALLIIGNIWLRTVTTTKLSDK